MMEILCFCKKLCFTKFIGKRRQAVNQCFLIYSAAISFQREAEFFHRSYNRRQKERKKPENIKTLTTVVLHFRHIERM